MKKKITFLVLHLGFGGVEKAVATQANILCNNYDVEILCAYRLYDVPPFPMDERVKIKYLLGDLKPNKKELSKAVKSGNPFTILREGIKALRILHKRTSEMKHALRTVDSDIVVSTRFLYNKLLCKNRPEGAVIAAEEHRHHNNDEKYIRKLISSVRNMDWFLPVSQELTDFYSERLRGNKVKCKYIPHCLDQWPEIPSELNKKRLISVGRLSYEKGFDDLPEIFSSIFRKEPTAVLDLVGDGNQKTIIEEKIREAGISQNMILHGYRSKEYIDALMKEASVFLMTSREESFGIVLLEAQSYGIPCVAFDSAHGAREIIHDGNDGFLIKNRDKGLYAAAVIALLNDGQLRESMGKNARKNAANYRREVIAKQWFDFYDKALRLKQAQLEN